MGSTERNRSAILVGKIISRDYYIHREAISNQEYNSKFNTTVLNLYFSALPLLNLEEGFDFDFVAIIPSTKCVRFLKMSSLTDPHPHVIDTRKVFVEEMIIKLGKITGNLYHRLELIISPSHKSYNFHKAITEYEESVGLLDFPVPYHLKKWNDKINSTVGVDTYNSKLTELRELYL